MNRRHAFVLPVVLVLIGLLAVTMASFIFFVRAETAGIASQRDGQQAKLTAESGLEEVIAMLRVAKHDSSQWFDNAERFRHALVWSDAFDRKDDPVKKAGSRKDLLNGSRGTVSPAWRYSVVAPSVNGVAGTMRFGLTPESSKLNLNTATDQQITDLLTPLLTNLGITNAPELVAALLDWRDADDDTRPGSAENPYYNTLKTPYNAKNGRFDTLEELLLVKGFSSAILYGEDANRNGILDPNEDDGDASAPTYDTADGILNNGIAPYLTVWTREPDTALDNKARINLRGPAAAVTAQMAANIPEGEISAGTLAWISQLKQSNFNFTQIASPAELFQGVGAIPDEEGDIATSQPASGEDEEGGVPTSQPTSQPAGGTPAALRNSPVTMDELPAIMDRFSTIDPAMAQQGIEGLININTAPYEVLVLVPGMSPEAAGNIVALRQQLAPELLRSTAWALTNGAVSTKRFHAIAPYITTKAYQFHVEVLGYADHIKIFKRYEWVVEMVGPLAQVKYFRDLTSLGFAWPIDNDQVTVSSHK